MPSSLATDHSSTFGFSPRPPVSVSGTGSCSLALEVFLGSMVTRGYPLRRGFAVLSGSPQRGDLPPLSSATPFNALPSVRARSTSPSLLRNCSRYWNINQLSIGYAFRLRLRSRLTLIRLSLIRKPWSSGGRVFHPPYRYLCLHLLFQNVHHGSRRGFGRAGMLPYR